MVVMLLCGAGAGRPRFIRDDSAKIFTQRSAASSTLVVCLLAGLGLGRAVQPIAALCERLVMHRAAGRTIGLVHRLDPLGGLAGLLGGRLHQVEDASGAQALDRCRNA